MEPVIKDLWPIAVATYKLVWRINKFYPNFAILYKKWFILPQQEIIVCYEYTGLMPTDFYCEC